MFQVKACQAGSITQMEVQQQPTEIPLLLGGGSIFCSIRPSADWMRPTDSMEGNELYSIN